MPPPVVLPAPPRIEPSTPRVEAVAPPEDEVMDLPEVRDEFEGSPILLGDDSVTTEYIATVTLADIFASQGYAAKALKIYRDVLRRQPDNADVRRKIEALEKGEPIVRSTDEPRADAVPAPPAPPAMPSSSVPIALPAPPPSTPAAAPAPAGAAIGEGRSYEQFKRWLRTVSD
jgi:hypothetical protein